MAVRESNWRREPRIFETRSFPHSAPRTRVAARILLFGIAVLLMFAVLALGATQPWAVFALEAGAVFLFVIWGAQQVWSQCLEIVSSPLYLPGLLFGALVTLQLVLRLSAYRYASTVEAQRLAAFAILFFLVVQISRTAANVRLLGWMVTVFGSAVAMFSLVQSLTFNGRIYWVWQTGQFGVVYGPYVNHSHYSGLMEMLAPFPLVLAISEFLPGPVRFLCGFAAALMGATIFLSQSRGGIVAFLLELVLLGVFIALQRRHRSTLKWFLPFAAVVVVLGWLGGTSTYHHLATFRDPLQPSLAGFRLKIVHDSFKMIAAKPVLGWGLGTFPAVYPQFRSFYTSFFINQAHNDYLQVLVETGVVGLVFVLWFVARLYRTGLAQVDHWWQDRTQAVKLAALVGCTGLLIHSFGDFNLHIPANAAWFYVLAAVASTRIEEQIA